MIKTISWPCWPQWNFHFNELDVNEITSVTYYDKDDNQHEYPLDKVRLTCGHNGVSGIVFKEKHALPALKPFRDDKGNVVGRADAVTVTYDCEEVPNG